MTAWLVKNCGRPFASLVFTGYFAFYVLTMREQRALAGDGKPRLPCDRC